MFQSVHNTNKTFFPHVQCNSTCTMHFHSYFNPFPNKPWFFTCLRYKSFENTVGKGEIARNEQFLLFPQCFLPIWRAFCHFYQTGNCRLQTLSVWKSLKIVAWERVKRQCRLISAFTKTYPIIGATFVKINSLPHIANI